MIDANDLVGAFARNSYVVKAPAEGPTNEDSLIQLPHGNSLNWVLGHIVVSRDEALGVLGEPPTAGARVERYKRGSEPITGACDDALPLAELLTLLDQAQERIEATLSRMDAAALARKSADDERGRTIGQRAFFLYFHETYHVGQTELFRQLAGRDDKLI
ncbi:MAG TPA: DinB family protein [Ktedonobacterales bacterium]|nr:DinB family protein [Ktedonobacterales bacterium]